MGDANIEFRDVRIEVGDFKGQRDGVTRFVRLDDFVHPQARGGIPDVELFVVGFFDAGLQLFLLLRAEFLTFALEALQADLG